MRLCWLTDIHLNFLDETAVDSFLDEVHASGPDAILISGDIGDANSTERFLRLFRDRFAVPVYFVLGNHDYYHGSIEEVTGTIQRLSREPGDLVWLDQSDPILLKDGVSLIGHGSWADGRLGDYNQSDVLINDYLLIKDLSEMRKVERLWVMQQLAARAAAHLESTLPMALNKSGHIICLTHVPPFQEACWHEGQVSDRFWLPHFSCQAVGDTLLRHMDKHPEKSMTVLCGHTHSSGEAKITNNLLVLTGSAAYGKPQIQRILNV